MHEQLTAQQNKPRHQANTTYGEDDKAPDFSNKGHETGCFKLLVSVARVQWPAQQLLVKGVYEYQFCV
jgi:hypothetical protein